MPSIRGSLEDGQPLVTVLISSFPQIEASFQSHEFLALIDTGSTKTCVTRTVVEALQLQPHSRVLVATPSGLERRKAYNFTIGFVDEGDRSIGAVRRTYVFPTVLTGADFVKNSNFDVLIGMDILAQGRLLFEHGDFEFGFG